MKVKNSELLMLNSIVFGKNEIEMQMKLSEIDFCYKNRYGRIHSFSENLFGI